MPLHAESTAEMPPEDRQFSSPNAARKMPDEVSEARATLDEVLSILGREKGVYKADEMKELMELDPEYALQSINFSAYTDPPPDDEDEDEFDAFRMKSDGSIGIDPRTKIEKQYAAAAIFIYYILKESNLPIVKRLRQQVLALDGDTYLQHKALLGIFRTNTKEGMHALENFKKPDGTLDDFTFSELCSWCQGNKDILRELHASAPDLYEQVMTAPVLKYHSEIDPPEEFAEKSDKELMEDATFLLTSFSFRKEEVSVEEAVVAAEFILEHTELLSDEESVNVPRYMLGVFRRFEPSSIPDVFIKLYLLLIGDKSIHEEIERTTAWNWMQFCDEAGNFRSPDELMRDWVIEKGTAAPLIKGLKNAGLHDPLEEMRTGILKTIPTPVLECLSDWWQANRAQQWGMTPDKAIASFTAYINTQKERLRHMFICESQWEDGRREVTEKDVREEIKCKVGMLLTVLTNRTVEFSDLAVEIIQGMGHNPGTEEKEFSNRLLHSRTPEPKDIWPLLEGKVEPDRMLYWMFGDHNGGEYSVFQKVVDGDTDRFAAWLSRFLSSQEYANYEYRGLELKILKAIVRIARGNRPAALGLLRQLCSCERGKDIVNSSDGHKEIVAIAYGGILTRPSEALHSSHITESGDTMREHLHRLLRFTDKLHVKDTGRSFVGSRVTPLAQDSFVEQYLSTLINDVERIQKAKANEEFERRNRAPTKKRVSKFVQFMLNQLQNIEPENTNVYWGDRQPQPPTETLPEADAPIVAKLEWAPTGNSCYLPETFYESFDAAICCHLPVNSPKIKEFLELLRRQQKAQPTKAMAIELIGVRNGSGIISPHEATVDETSVVSTLPKPALLQNVDGTFRLSSGDPQPKDPPALLQFRADVPTNDNESGNATIEEVHEKIASLCGEAIQKPNKWLKLVGKKAVLPEVLQQLTTPFTALSDLPKDLKQCVAEAKKAKSAHAAIDIIRAKVHTFKYDLDLLKESSYHDLLRSIRDGKMNGIEYIKMLHERRGGICGDLSTVYVDLLRHAGIPALWTGGYMTTDTSIPAHGAHAWVTPVLADAEGKLFLDVEEATNASPESIAQWRELYAESTKKEKEEIVPLHQAPEVEGTSKSAEEIGTEVTTADAEEFVSSVLKRPTHHLREYVLRMAPRLGLESVIDNPEHAKQIYRLARACDRLAQRKIDADRGTIEEEMKAVDRECPWRDVINTFDAYTYLASSRSRELLHRYEGEAVIDPSVRQAFDSLEKAVETGVSTGDLIDLG